MDTLLLNALEKELKKLSIHHPQFPEAMCDIATSLVLKKRYREHLTWRTGVVNCLSVGRRVPHCWIVDVASGLNIDLTAAQFEHVRVHMNRVMSSPGEILVASDAEIRRLGYTWGEREWHGIPHNLKILKHARKEYKEIKNVMQ